MNANKDTLEMPTRGEDYVYVLATEDKTRLKIGRSIDLLERIAGLINLCPEIDFSRSAVVVVDTHCVEAVLHNVFSNRREKLMPRRDGHTGGKK